MGKKKTSGIVELRRRLLAFYDGKRRALPWRGETDPYRVWVSEVMLQQTRVETVIPYYEKWVERFPNLETLAKAEEDEVLRAWQGLGYYSRARRLQQGARMVRERFGGKLPTNSIGLKELPGVGEYTAGAVASIAFGEVVPAVDGNVRRVLSRLQDLPDPSPTELRELAGALVDPGRPGDFNQALMELGALVCTPRNPRCGDCPISNYCAALARGTVPDRPVGKERASVPEVDMAVLVVAARDQAGVEYFLLRRRPPEGLLAGMWEFPGVEADEEAASGPGGGMGAEGAISLEIVSHTFTHLKIRYHPVLLRLEDLSPTVEAAFSGMAEATLSGMAEAAFPGIAEATLPDWLGRDVRRTSGSTYRWVPVDALNSIPLPVAQTKIADAAQEQLET